MGKREKNVRRLTLPAGMLLFLFLLSCITINIYFPAEKVESVAGEIVGDIRGTGKDTPEEKPQKDSRIHKSFYAFAVTRAWAEDVTAVSNATIRGLKEKMKARYETMKPYYDKGLLEEGDDGYVALGDTSGLGLRERRDVRALVEAENKDREKLYQEVARALEIDPSQVNRVAKIFAKEWQKTGQ